MKLSVSLPDEDVAFLEAYAQAAGLASRSAVVHQAVLLLRRSELASAYEEAWNEWTGSTDEAVWEAAGADGLPA